MKAMTAEDKKNAQKKSNGAKSGRMRVSEKTRKLAILGLLAAITIIMGFTPIGYIPVGALKITFMTLPVIVAAAILDPADAAIVGGMFGLTSFIQAATGMSALTGALFQLNPVLTFLLCVVPRVLEGLLGGLIFKGLSKIDKTKFISYVVTSLSVPVLNTILFMSALYAEVKIIAASNSSTAGLSEDMAATFTGIADKAAGDVILFFGAMIGVNAIVEAAVCFVVGTAITKALAAALGKKKR